MAQPIAVDLDHSPAVRRRPIEADQSHSTRLRRQLGQKRRPPRNWRRRSDVVVKSCRAPRSGSSRVCTVRLRPAPVFGCHISLPPSAGLATSSALRTELEVLLSAVDPWTAPSPSPLTDTSSCRQPIAFQHVVGRADGQRKWNSAPAGRTRSRCSIRRDCCRA